MQVITIEEQKNQGRFIRRADNGMEDGLIGRIGLKGAISCGLVRSDGHWETLGLSAYPGLEVNSVPDRSAETMVSHYIVLPEQKPPSGVILAFCQQVSETAILIVPLAVPEGQEEFSEWRTYFLRGKIE